MPEFQSTRHVLAVLDLRIATDYYLNVLGFQRDFGDESDGWSFLSHGAYRVMLGECKDAIPAKDLGDHSYYAHALLDDVDAYYEQVRSKGAEIMFPPVTRPWGLREFGIRTPDGHRMMIAQPMPGVPAQ